MTWMCVLSLCFQFGVARWYALPGNITASGDAYDVNSMTIAHRTLPLGAKVSIFGNGTIVSPVVNDRGPFCYEVDPCPYIVDMTPAVASELGMSYGYNERGDAYGQLPILLVIRRKYVKHGNVRPLLLRSRVQHRNSYERKEKWLK